MEQSPVSPVVGGAGRPSPMKGRTRAEIRKQQNEMLAAVREHRRNGLPMSEAVMNVATHHGVHASTVYHALRVVRNHRKGLKANGEKPTKKLWARHKLTKLAKASKRHGRFGKQAGLGTQPSSARERALQKALLAQYLGRGYDVLEMVRLYDEKHLTQREIGEKVGLDQTIVSRLIRAYKHIPSQPAMGKARPHAHRDGKVWRGGPTAAPVASQPKLPTSPTLLEFMSTMFGSLYGITVTTAQIAKVAALANVYCEPTE